MNKYGLIFAVLCVIVNAHKQVDGEPMNSTGQTDLAITNRTTIGTTETTTVTTSVSEKHSRHRHRRRYPKITEEDFKNAMAKELENIETSRKECLNKDESFFYDITTKTCRYCGICRTSDFSGSCTMQCRAYFTTQRLQKDLDWQKTASCILIAVTSIMAAALLCGIYVVYKQWKKASKMKTDLDKLTKKFTSGLASSDEKGANNNGCDASSATLHSEANLDE